MPGPLSNLKILDFTTLLPGPYATMALADMGADVLKIVSGSRPDVVAYIQPFVPGTKMSAAFVYLGRGKRCMTLNLKDSRAIKIVHQLVADYDIVIEQFRPGVMAKFSLDYESLKKVNPSLIYCSLTGYGQTGPLRDRAGHDINYMARSGLMSYSGKKETGPSLTGMQIADIASGSNNAVIGILAAVVHRDRTGKGQHLDISMTDGMIAFNAMFGAGFLVDGKDLARENTLLNGGSLYDFYETKDGHYMSFGGLEPQFLSAFLNALGLSEYIPRLMEPDLTEELRRRVSDVIGSKDLSHWVKVFKDVDACVEPVLTVLEAASSEHAKARGLVVEVPGPDGVPIRQIAYPIRFSQYKPEYLRAGPALGQDTRDVLNALGLSEAEIADLKSKGIINGA